MRGLYILPMKMLLVLCISIDADNCLRPDPGFPHSLPPYALALGDSQSHLYQAIGCRDP